MFIGSILQGDIAKKSQPNSSVTSERFKISLLSYQGQANSCIFPNFLGHIVEQNLVPFQGLF